MLRRLWCLIYTTYWLWVMVSDTVALDRSYLPGSKEAFAALMEEALAKP
jgi:hypothetical protein